jgi:hypothetical protein
MDFVKSLRDTDLSKYIEFNLTRYYSPQPGQNKYFSSIKGYYSNEYMEKFARYTSGYEMDVCMNCGCQLDMGLTEQLYDCEKPAD